MDSHAAMYRRLLSVFSAEAAERIHRTNGELLALERGDEGTDRTEALTVIMRELHTLKGAGGSVNLEDVETLSHDLESVFGPIVEGQRELTPPVFTVAYRTLDAIGELIAAAVEERTPSVDVSSLLREMRETGSADVDAITPSPAPAEAAEEGEDEAVPAADVDRDSLLRSFAELDEVVSPRDWVESLEEAFESYEAKTEAGDEEPEVAEVETEVDDEEPEVAEVETEVDDEEPEVAEVETEVDFEAESDDEPEVVDAEPDVDAAVESWVAEDGDELDQTASDDRPAATEPIEVDGDQRGAPSGERSEGDEDASTLPDEELVHPDAARARVLAIFASESLDRVKTINRRLMALERDPDTASGSGAAALSEILRELHTLKGSSATVHVETVEALAHQLEALLGAVRDGERKLDPVAFDVAYRALDAVESAVGAAVRGEEPNVDDAAWPRGFEGAPPEAARATIGAEEAPVEQPAEPAQAVVKTAAEDTVRVSISKLDALMGNVSELLVTRAGTEQRLADARSLIGALADVEADWADAKNRLSHLLPPEGSEITLQPERVDQLVSSFVEAEERVASVRERAAELVGNLEGDGRRLATITEDLQDDVRRARMLPVATVFDAFPRLIRDLAHDLEKRATLLVEGADTEVDRSVIEQIRAPLTHLLRNAIDHGLESPSERELAGKPEEGTIWLSASQRGDSMLIEVRDDGAGIDPQEIRSLAVERGILSQEAADVTNDADALRLIFRAGFSTRGVVTDLSGRGVGLDVVRDAIEHLRGSVEVESVIGEGTRFALQLPLSVATAECVMTEVAGRMFALPISNVSRILRLTHEQSERAEGRLVTRIDQQPTPVASLAQALGLEDAANAVDGLPRPAVVLASGERKVVFVVDELLGTQTLVLKPLPAPLVRLRHISGAAILGTGDVIGVLNAADLVRRDEPASGWASALKDQGRGVATDSVMPTVLIVDDSSVTRMMVKTVLEGAGYRVQTAADGMEAWELLRSKPFDLLVTDVNMPEMSGFDLTEKVRADRLLKEVPIILVTALDSPEDQARGAQVGANAFIPKGGFTGDRLLETVRGLV